MTRKKLMVQDHLMVTALLKVLIAGKDHHSNQGEKQIGKHKVTINSTKY